MTGGSRAVQNVRPQQTTSHYGRDELNLAEFPLASLSDRVPNGQKTLEYSDIIWDQGRREHVPRKLIITASDKYGLPTAKDDDVILALIQLTAQQKFEGQTVLFTRYQIIKQLGWKDTSQNYQRLETSLKRWLGVTLYYDRAWWSKDEDCWVNKSFHILSDLELLDRESRSRRLKAGEGDPRSGQSSFTWSDVVFRSFQAGNLKQIDMKVFRSLKSPVAKRMYRYLDKRFYHRTTLRFELKQFACSHIGLSSKYHTGEIKRRLRDAVAELEQIGFIVPLLAEKRYAKDGKTWYVTFTHNAKKPRNASATSVNHPAIVNILVSRGVSKQQAIKLAAENSHDTIQRQVEYLDHLVAAGDGKVSKNPAGYLYRAITDDYAIPRTFETKDAQAARLKGQQVKRAQEKRRRQQLEAQSAADERVKQEWLADAWAKLDPKERLELEQEADLEAKRLLGRHTGDGPVAKAIRDKVLLERLRSA